jgi:hypothetical protein
VYRRISSSWNIFFRCISSLWEVYSFDIYVKSASFDTHEVHIVKKIFWTQNVLTNYEAVTGSKLYFRLFALLLKGM